MFALRCVLSVSYACVSWYPIRAGHIMKHECYCVGLAKGFEIFALKGMFTAKMFCLVLTIVSAKV